MDKYLGLETILEPFPCVLTLGNFDGVHLGHQRLIRRLVESARVASKASVVLTFSPHPKEILCPDKSFPYLFSREDLEQRLQAMGVSCLVIQNFDKHLSSLEAEEFLTNYVLRYFSLQKLIVGYDFSLGANKSGTLEFLEKYCQSHRIELEVVSAEYIREKVISSSEVRRLLSLGKVDEAEELLGRPYYVKGVVEAGEGRGKSIGVPTINLALPLDNIIDRGVYITDTECLGKKYRSVTNIGYRPTFNSSHAEMTVETHILNFSEDVYEKTVKIYFIKKIREELKFQSAQQLVAQIQQDIYKAEVYVKMG